MRKQKGHKIYRYRDIMECLARCTSSMNEINDLLKECLKNVGIVSLHYLHHVMDSDHVSCFGNYLCLNDSSLVDWLLEGANFQNLTDPYETMDDMESVPVKMMDAYACSVISMKHNIDELRLFAHKAEGYEKENMKNVMMMTIIRLKYMMNKLREPFEPNVALMAKLSKEKNLRVLHPERRWMLYKHWVSKTVDYYQQKIMRSRLKYQALNKSKLMMLEGANEQALLECDVVGMTTTGAAKHQSLLQRLGCKIVIVEEAAEAMESHVVVSLSSKCEHLILIGDHKQLRPSPAVYKLGKEYHLDISLFERLLMNRISYDTLRIQHRMRPDIADLVFPAVYPVLENHPSVLAYDNIIGLKKNLYFINHSQCEETAVDDLSKKNPHEAKFLIALCRHIILQGYDPKQITVLATYLGQMFLLTEERNKYKDLDDVKIVVVDNYQGEENDIILLSLVRNNEEGKIGFLASENRTCVALSRAKMGLYIMGNIDLLAGKSRLWSQIRKVLEGKEALGTHLTLQCLKHPEQLTEVSKAEDFNEINQGGCRLDCLERLNCGHICKEKCHAHGHIGYKCRETCNKVMCNHDHRCQKLCWQTCGDCMVPVECSLPCGHTATLPCHLDPKEYKCKVVVSAKLPDCEHTNEKPCYLDLEFVTCSFPCDSRLPCGHVCVEKCHMSHGPEHLRYKCLKPCNRKNLECKDEHMCQRKCHEECGMCTVIVKKKLPNCDHHFAMECSVDPSTIICRKPCKKRLDCGHPCPKECKDPCGGCQRVSEKEIPDCSHKMKMKCCEVPVRSMCKEKCGRTLNCGHTCTGICGEPCNENKCLFISDQTARALCGHEVSIFCHEVKNAPDADTLMDRCKEACGKTLECSHKCKGTCGECMQGRIHVLCQEKCGRKLICGHECTVLCSQVCPQCKEDCLVCCEHFKCKNKCGKPCSFCKKKCGWQCAHQTCSKMCSELCDRPPCNEPCKEKLKCGHECIGFCGEKCPDLCRVCSPKEISDIMSFLGMPDNINSRFVVLPDCGHVFEVTALDKLLSMNSYVVTMLECPRCKRAIQLAHRYRNTAKMRFNRVMRVKYEVFGNLRRNNQNLVSSAKRLWHLTRSAEFKKSWPSLENLQQQIRMIKRAHFGAVFLNSLEARSAFVIALAENFHELRNKVNPQGALQNCLKTANLLIRKILSRLDSITLQEHSDFEGECMRFHLKMQLCALENTYTLKTSTKTTWYHEYEKCRLVVEGTGVFNKDKYWETHRKMNEIYETIPVSSRDKLLLISLISKRRVLSRSAFREVGAKIDLHQGSWLECPSGHVYVTSGFGNGVKMGKCNQCGSEIGSGVSWDISNSSLPKI